MLSDYYKVDQASPSGLVSVRTGKPVGTLSRMGYRVQVKRGNAYMRTTRPTLEEAIAVRDLMLEGLYV